MFFKKNDKTKCESELNNKRLLLQPLRLPFNLELISIFPSNFHHESHTKKFYMRSGDLGSHGIKLLRIWKITKYVLLLSESIEIIELGHSVGDILHFNNITSVIFAIVLGIFVLVGILIRGLFIYYIQCKAPNDRPINKMILCDQVFRYLYMSITFGFYWIYK